MHSQEGTVEANSSETKLSQVPNSDQLWGEKVQTGTSEIYASALLQTICKQSFHTVTVVWPTSTECPFPIPRGFRSPVGYTEHISPLVI